jgi:hypothetical protein
MSTKPQWFQIQLRLLFFVTIAVAAFFAGRSQMAENARRAKADADTALERSVHLEQISEFWRNVALCSRADLHNDVGRAGRILHSRPGEGGSWGVLPLYRDESIRPRCDRWEIAFSEDVDQYLKQLDFYGVQLAAIWHNPPAIVVLSDYSEGAPKSPLEEVPENCLVMTADYLDYKIIERRVRRTNPDLVVRLLPQGFQNHLVAAELKALCKTLGQNASLKDVEKTHFAVENQEGAYRLEVADQSLSRLRP